MMDGEKIQKKPIKIVTSYFHMLMGLWFISYYFTVFCIF